MVRVMPYPRRLAEEFAGALPLALKELNDRLFVWERAAELAGLPTVEVRVLEEVRMTFLIGQEWVVYNDGTWMVRPWEGKADDLYESAIDVHALDDPSEA